MGPRSEATQLAEASKIRDMEIHATAIVRNEADVIAQCLEAASKWCHRIYVLDNGSTDDTWGIVQTLAREVPAVVPWKTEQTPFSDGLRATIFNRFRTESSSGDWWCRLDADEFYIDDPRLFLQKVPEKYDVVWTTNFSYYFTDKDAEQYRDAPQRYGDDIPVDEKIRYYINHWSEPRFFRFRDDIVWPQNVGFPPGVYGSPAYPVRMWLKHFPYRSPQQIERRLADRQEAISRGVFVHEAVAEWGTAVAAIKTHRTLLDRADPEFATARWEDRIVPASSLEFDAHDGRFIVNESLMPELPGEPSAAGRVTSRLRGTLRRLRRTVRARIADARRARAVET